MHKAGHTFFAYLGKTRLRPGGLFDHVQLVN